MSSFETRNDHEKAARGGRALERTARPDLETAEEMADKGLIPYAYVVAWGGLEAAMRRIRDGAESYGRSTPTELMRTLYGNGLLNREQFVRLKGAYKIRTQVVHGLVPTWG